MLVHSCILFVFIVMPCQSLDCDVNGKCINSNLIDATSALDPQDCLKICNDQNDCRWYSFLADSQTCFEFSDCNTLDTSCQNCFSGQRECLNSDNTTCPTINGCCQGPTIDYIIADNAEECRDTCHANDNCQWFTYQIQEHFCILLQDCSSITDENNDKCTSGQDDCNDDPECETVDGCCQGDTLTYGNAANALDCQDQCQNYENDQCQWYTYNQENSICILLRSCDSLTNENNGVCTSGQVNCDDPPTPEAGPLVLVALGRNKEIPLKSVEILDLRNGKTCAKNDSLSTSSGGFGALVTSNKAIFCGGNDLANKCLYLDQSSMWSTGPSMIKERSYAGMSKVRNGILVSGGMGNTIEETMEYFDGQAWRLLKSDLEDGLFGHCQLALNPNTSLIIGGRSLTSGITDKTWFVTIHSLDKSENIEFTEGPRLLDARHNFGCVFDELSNKVIIIGGSENEITSEILDLNQDDPAWEYGPELPNNSPAEDLVLVSNPDFGIVLIGGNNPITDVAKSAVWELVNDQWQYLPNLQLSAPRTSFVAFSIPDSFSKC